MNFLLNKGGAGKSLTRSKTAVEASRLLTSHIQLLRTYGNLTAAMGAENASVDSVDSVKALQKEHRDDIAKISEIILSSGGVPPREADSFEGDDIESLLRAVDDGERSLRRSLEEQLTQKHHLRTIAIMETLLVNTERRIGVIQTLAQQLKIPVG